LRRDENGKYEKWGLKLLKNGIFRKRPFRGIANQWKYSSNCRTV
jgi:hypothetical protein